MYLKYKRFALKGMISEWMIQLTHLPLDKMAPISQTMFSDAFSWMKSFVFWLKIRWSLFLRIQMITRTPAFWGYPPPPNDYPYHWVILDPKSKEDKVKVTNLKNSPKFQIFEFWNGHYMGHTFWSCLIRCANMKWIWWVLLKIQSGHDSVHRWDRRTDGRTDRRTRWYQYTPLSTSLKRGV